MYVSSSSSTTSTANNTQQQQTSSKNIASHPAFRAFISTLKSKRTKDLYTLYLTKYYLLRPENRQLTMDQILSKTPKEIEYELIGIVDEMRDVGLSYSSINLAIVSICHFFEINDVIINKKKINRLRGANIDKYEYRAYTTEEIAKLLNVCDERMKAVVLLMASTGMRVGALPDLKIKHLKKWAINGSSPIYQITVYANSPKDRYYTFCTPEAARALDDYLVLRKRYGDDAISDPNAFLFIHTFDKSDPSPIINKRPISSIALAKTIVCNLVATGLRTHLSLADKQCDLVDKKRLAAIHRNELHPCHSLRIFAVTNMQRAKVDKTIREMLVGHSTGLDKSYYKPQEEEILEEYLKAVDNLTINNENRLKKQLDFYKYRQDRLDELTLEFKDLDDRMKRAGL